MKTQRSGAAPRTSSGAACLLAAALACSACTAKPQATVTPEVRVALATAPLSFDPHATNDIVAFSVNSNIYDTLVTTDTDLRPLPRLAARWFNPDDRTWDFEMTPGLRFQDGSPLTSADVAFSLLRARNDPLSEWGASLLTIDGVETPSPGRVVVHTRSPDATLLLAVAQTLIVPRTAGPIAGSPLKQNPVGSGPYRLDPRRPALGSVELLAWDGFWGERPSVSRLTFTAIPDDRRRVAALLAGRQDLVSEVSPELAPSIRSGTGVRLLETPSLLEVYMGFDVMRERTPYASPTRNPFRDRRVRRAFLAAIDRQQLVRSVLQGAGDEANQLVASSVFGFDPGLPRPLADVPLARRLLAEAGLPEGFSVTFDSPATSFAGDARVAPFVARALGEIGVRVQLRRLAKAELFRRLTQRDTSLFIGAWVCVSGDLQEVLDFLLHTPDAARGYGSENSGGYSNPRLDQLAEEAHQTMVRDRRLQLLRAAAGVAMEDVPYVPLYHPRDRYGVRADLRWRPRPDRLIIGERMAFE